MVSEHIEEITAPKIVIDGKEIDLSAQPEFVNYMKSLTAKIAVQEKNKVHSKFEKLKEAVDNLQKVEVNAPKPETAFDKDGFKKEILSELKEVFAEAIKPITKMAGEAEAVSINAYRNELLEANQGKVIPELVVGNTKEELDAALQASLELHGKYVGKNGATPNAPIVEKNVAEPQVQIVEPPVLPAVQRTEPIPSNIPNIKEMSMTDFGSKREALKEQLAEFLATGG